MLHSSDLGAVACILARHFRRPVAVAPTVADTTAALLAPLLAAPR